MPTIRTAILALALAAAAAAATAHAATVDFTIKDGATVEATGSFSYGSANTNLSYSDLTAFTLSFTAGPPGFDLNFALDPNRATCGWFDYDTVTQQFVTGSGLNCFGLPELLGAMSSDFGTGFIFVNSPYPSQYFSSNDIGVYHQPYDTIILSVEPVPEPGSLALIAVALLGLGWLGRRARKAGSRRSERPALPSNFREHSREL